MTEARFTAIEVDGVGAIFTLQGRTGATATFKHPNFMHFVQKTIALVMPDRTEFNRPSDTDELLNIWFDFDEEGTF